MKANTKRGYPVRTGYFDDDSFDGDVEGYSIDLVGVTFENRQENLADLYGEHGKRLIPGRAVYETYNLHDLDALYIEAEDKKLGYIPRESDIKPPEGPVWVRINWHRNQVLGATVFWPDTD